MKPIYDSYYGLYCGTSENLLVSEKGEVELVAKGWNDQPAEIRCFGCKSKKNSNCCVDCYFKKGCVSKNLDFCFECVIFPWSNLLKFKSDKYPHHSILLKNLISHREKGLREWSTVQKNRWSCSICGSRFTWYDKQRKKCGESLYSCEEEEKNLQNF